MLSTSTEKKAFAENAYETTPTVSIVVPCRNEKDQIGNAVESILGQEPPPGGFEIIIADGMSDDGTREILMPSSREDSMFDLSMRVI